MENNNPKLLNVMTYLCYGFSAIAFLLSVNGYFEFINLETFVGDLGEGNFFFAFLVQFLAISTLYMLAFFMIFPHIKERELLSHIFSIACHILPLIPIFLLSSDKIHMAYMALLVIYVIFFITNEVILRQQYYPNGNYYIFKILGTIGFLSTALMIQKTNAISVLLG